MVVAPLLPAAGRRAVSERQIRLLDQSPIRQTDQSPVIYATLDDPLCHLPFQHFAKRKLFGFR